MCFSVEGGLGGAGACTGAPRPSPSHKPAHNTKVSREDASSQVMRIAARSAFLELVTEVTAVTAVTEATEVVSRPAARTPPSARAGGQDDGSLNKLPQMRAKFVFAPQRQHNATGVKDPLDVTQIIKDPQDSR